MSYGYQPYQSVYPTRPINPGIPGYTYPGRHSAPASVHVVAVLQYLVGVAFLLVAGLSALVAFGAGRYNQNLHGADGLLTHIGLAVAAVLAFVGLLVIGIGRKLQRGRQWARILVLVLSVLSLVGTVYDGLLGTGNQANALGGVVFPVLYLILLNTRAARSWFRSHTY
jgi:hypothetical protein